MRRKIRENRRIMMKKIILIIGFSLLAATFLLIANTGSNLFAISGCCKQRESFQKNWYRNGVDFETCRDFNKRDGDDVFNESGLFWWDIGCQ